MQLLHAKILGEGEPLLILHGLLGMGDNWISLGRIFANNGYQVHLIDQRNHGKSFHSDEMNYEVMVEDLQHYTNHFKLHKINIIGHSMGGKTAMHYAMTHPKSINKLIIVDIAPVNYPPHHHFIFDTINQINLSNFSSRKDIAQAIEKYIDKKSIANFLLKNLFRDKSGNYHWKANINILENSLEELGEAIPSQSSFSKNTLFIKGEKSPYIQKTYLPIINTHFPNSNVITIKNSGHWVHAEQAKIFFDKVLHFLDSK